MLEVGVLEMGGIFKAVAEEAVEADVGGPDQGDVKELRFGSEVGDGGQAELAVLLRAGHGVPCPYGKRNNRAAADHA